MDDISEDLIREAQGLRRRRGPVNYNAEQVIEEVAAPSKPKAKAKAKAQASNKRAAPPPKRPSGQRRAARKGGSSDDDEDSEESEDSDDSAPRRKRGKGKAKASKFVQRRSDRGGERGKYAEPDEYDDDLVDSDEEEEALAARWHSAPETFAEAPAQSVYEKLLSQREADDHAEEGAAPTYAMEYLAKLRGKCARHRPSPPAPACVCLAWPAHARIGARPSAGRTCTARG